MPLGRLRPSLRSLVARPTNIMAPRRWMALTHSLAVDEAFAFAAVPLGALFGPLCISAVWPSVRSAHRPVRASRRPSPGPGSSRRRAQQRWQGLPCAVGLDRDQSDWGFLRFEESY
jgi:hypothetical protein